MLQIITFLFLFISSGLVAQTRYEKDFDEFWTTVKDNYAYLEKEKIDWDKVREIYSPEAASAKNNNDFIRLLEKVINELHNGHVSLNTNLPTSNRIIPSGSDILLRKIGGKYLVADLRMEYPAALSGLKIGMEVSHFNRRPIDEQLRAFLPKYAKEYNPKMFDYALEMLFAGTHDRPREITVMEKGKLKMFFPDRYPQKKQTKLLEFSFPNEHTGYIKINNSLGDNDLIAAFDSVLNTLLDCKTLVLDLSETPGGGNTTVARAIMGRFTDKELPYQKHELTEQPFSIRRSWVEYVSPREPVYKNKLVVVVGHWTGSMGEGMAIGFNGMNRAEIAGTRMAGLLGAISSFRLSNTGIAFQLPTERLYHVNGTAREDYLPRRLTGNIVETRKVVGEMIR